MNGKLAPHVQAAIAAAAQPKAAQPLRLASQHAPHVQAAVAQARTAAPPPGQRLPAPHVQAALSRTAQPKPLPAGPSGRPAAPPAPEVLQRAKRKAEVPMERKTRKKRRIDYSERNTFKRLDRAIKVSERKDQISHEKKQKENLEKYASQLNKPVEQHQTEERGISYGRGNEVTEVTSNRISKHLLLNAYARSKTDQLTPTFFYVPTLDSERRTLEQHFVVRKGHDYVLFPLVPDQEEVYRQEGQYGPSFEELAANAEAAALWLSQKDKRYGEIEDARARVAGDVNRLAGGFPARIRYPLEYLAGRSGLPTFGAVIRADKGRESKATKYIEGILKESSTSFQIRFGGESPTYIGTGKGGGRGPQGLRLKATEDPGEDSEYSSDEQL